MVLPKFSEIFIDFGSDGLAVSFREFLGYFVKQFWPTVRTQIDKLPYTRIDYPLLVLPFFLLAILATLAFWERPTRWRGVAAGFAGGLLFYVYFNAWVYWLIVLGLLSVTALLRRRAVPLGPLAALWTALALTAVPFFLNYLAFAATPGSQDFLYRQWIAEGREPGLTAVGYAYLFYAAIGLVVWRGYRRREPDKAAFLLVLLLAMAIVWNVQLVTGYVPAPDHWKRIASPVLYIIIFWLIWDGRRSLAARWPRLASALAIALVLLTTSAIVKKSVNAASLVRGLQPWVAAKYAFPAELADSWRWIDEHLESEPVIISPSTMTSQYLAVYTSARPYVPYGILTPLAMAEIEERFLTASRLFDVQEDFLRAELGDLDKIPPDCAGPQCFDQRLNFTKTRFNLYGCYFFRKPFNQAVNRVCAMPDGYREVMVERYRRLDVTRPLADAEYAYVGPHERQLGRADFRDDPRFTLVYENPLVEIYKIKK